MLQKTFRKENFVLTELPFFLYYCGMCKCFDAEISLNFHFRQQHQKTIMEWTQKKDHES